MTFPSTLMTLFARFSHSAALPASPRSLADHLFFLFPGVLLILDLMLTGSGRWMLVGGVTLRRVLIAILVGYAVIQWLLVWRTSVRGILAVTGLMFFITVWGIVVPMRYGIPLANALRDSQLFVGLLAAPALALIVGRTACWPGTLRLIELAAVFLAAVHITLFGIHQYLPDKADLIIAAMRLWLEPGTGATDATNFMIGDVSGALRIFWGSSIFLLLGLYLSVRNTGSRSRLIRIVFFVIMAYAINLSRTRAMLISIPLFLIGWYVFSHLFRQFRQTWVLYAAIGAMLLAITLPVTLMADPSFLEWVGLGRLGSDQIRYEQADALIGAFLHRPWMGSGLGSHVELIRSLDSPWSYELSILALWSKIGWLGAICLLGVFVLMGLCAWPAEIQSSNHQRQALARLLALLVCVIFCSNTNPYLFSLLGWALLLFIFLEVCAKAQTTHQAPVRLA